MLDFKQNFFGNAKPALEEIQITNDSVLRANLGAWLYENFDELAREYKANGRFLSLQEILDSPLDIT